MSVLTMVVYGYLINPGHPKEYCDEPIKVAAPYCSIVAGMPLMFLAGLWVGGWWGGQLGIKAALVVWLAYAVMIWASRWQRGMTAKMAMLVAISLLTKMAAAYAGAMVAVHSASHNAPLGNGRIVVSKMTKHRFVCVIENGSTSKHPSPSLHGSC